MMVRSSGVDREPVTPSSRVRSPRWFRSLGARLLAFALLLVVVPAAIFALLTFSSARRALEETVGRQLATAAHEAAEHLGDLLAREQKDLRVWSRQDVMAQLATNDPEGRIAPFLAAIVEQAPAYLAVECLRRDGTVLASSDATAVGDSRSGEAWFRPALAEKHAIRGPRANATGSGLVVDLASPVRRNGRFGEVLGVLHLALDWSHVEAMLVRSRNDLAMMGLNTDFFLVTGQAVIGSSRGAQAADSPGAPWAEAAARLSRQWSVNRPPGFVVDSKARAVAGLSLLVAGRPDWAVVVVQPLADALAPIHALQVRWVVVLVGLLIVAVAVVGVQGSRMIRPLRNLTAVTRHVAATGRPMPAPAVERSDEIGELTASFTTMASRLRQAQEDLVEATRLALVGELAAGVAHEVRTPLSVLRSSTQLLHRALPEGEKNADELAHLMLGEIDRLERVVVGLLELARPRPPVRVPTRLSEILGRVTDFVAARAAEKGVEIVRQLPADQPPALCDPDQIYQVALNLLVNAVQHVGAHGRIELRAVEGELGTVGFEVQDDGPGIAEALRDRIFLPFFTTRADGTGLGLALVKTIVEAHQGQVSLLRDAGRGSLFRVVLPAAEVFS